MNGYQTLLRSWLVSEKNIDHLGQVIYLSVFYERMFIMEMKQNREERMKAFVSEKDAYIKEHTTGYYVGYNEQVVVFIADILYDGRNIDDAVRSFFRAGYCYYFASMLKTAFERGDLFLTFPFGHVVWRDVDGRAYDVEGPYVPEDHECEELIPVSYLGDLIYDFMHVPGKEFTMGSKQFHEWAAFMHMTDAEAVTSIFMDMPKDNIDYFGVFANLSDDVYAYWMANERELSEKYWEKRKDGTL